MKTLYTANAKAVGGRDGHTETDDKKISLQLDNPGSKGPGSNPEQLFAAGYGACFSGAAQYVAKQQNVDVGGPIEVNAAVSLNQDDNGFFISVLLDVALPNLAPDVAAKLVHDAHQFCPYSKATRNNVDVTLKVNGTQI